MKNLFILILLLFTHGIYSQVESIQLLQINSKWNLKNDIKRSELPNSYLAHKIIIDHATLENQGPVFQKSFAGKPLPILILKINGKMKYQWTADLSFKLKVSEDEIIQVIKKIIK